MIFWSLISVRGGKQPLEAALAKTQIHWSIMRERKPEESVEKLQKWRWGCVKFSWARKSEETVSTSCQPKRKREHLSTLERERGRERERGSTLNHVARPHISLCSCVRQSERRRGESTSDSCGNSGTTYHLTKRDRCAYAKPHRKGERPAGRLCTATARQSEERKEKITKGQF